MHSLVSVKTKNAPNLCNEVLWVKVAYLQSESILCINSKIVFTRAMELICKYHLLRPSSHGNVIGAFYLRSNFWHGQIGCSLRNGTNFFELGRERNRSVDMVSACLLDGNGTERLRIVQFFVSLFGRSICLERNGSIWRVPVWRQTFSVTLFETIRSESGTITFPCERGLNDGPIWY